MLFIKITYIKCLPKTFPLRVKLPESEAEHSTHFVFIALCSGTILSCRLSELVRICLLDIQATFISLVSP